MHAMVASCPLVPFSTENCPSSSLEASKRLWDEAGLRSLPLHSQAGCNLLFLQNKEKSHSLKALGEFFPPSKHMVQTLANHRLFWSVFFLGTLSFTYLVGVARKLIILYCDIR